MFDENDLEYAYRLEALRLANHAFEGHDADVIVAAAEEYLEFLFAADEDEEPEYDVPTFSPQGEPILARFSLDADGLLYLYTLIGSGLALGALTGVPADNEVSLFGESILDEIEETFAVVEAGAQV